MGWRAEEPQVKESAHQLPQGTPDSGAWNLKGLVSSFLRALLSLFVLLGVKPRASGMMLAKHSYH